MKLSTSTQYALQFFSFLVKCLRNMFGLVVVSADLLLLISTFFVFAYERGRGIRTQVLPWGDWVVPLSHKALGDLLLVQSSSCFHANPIYLLLFCFDFQLIVYVGVK
jgi:hypothetical protein